jgi:YD repeat protein
LNLYAYCGNDPVNRYDPTGHFWDYIFDAVFLVWSIVDVIKNPTDWKNWVALGIDVVFAVIPFVPSGAGQVIKVGNKIDNFVDVASTINKIDNLQDISKVTMIGRNMNRVENTASLIGKADNLYDTWKGYDKSARALKKFIHNSFSMAHNGGWLFGKLRKGYTVIDIGVTTMHKGIKAFGLWYGTERTVLALWKTRNIWKLPLNYFL